MRLNEGQYPTAGSKHLTAAAAWRHKVDVLRYNAYNPWYEVAQTHQMFAYASSLGDYM